jgi:hypothetical protein
MGKDENLWKNSPLIKGAEGVVPWFLLQFLIIKAPTFGSQPPLSPFSKGESLHKE